MEYLNEMAIHSTNDSYEFNHINQKINTFMKFLICFEVMSVSTIVILTILALSRVSSDKQLPLNIYIPFDWKNSQITYWIIFGFNLYALIIILAGIFFSGIIWYLMMSCGTKYQILGNAFSKIGFMSKADSVHGEQDIFVQELIALMKIHQHLQKYGRPTNIGMKKVIH